MQTAPFNSNDCMSTTKDGRLNQKEQLFLSERKQHYHKGYSSKAYKMVDK